jgi:hypothetical protein
MLSRFKDGTEFRIEWHEAHQKAYSFRLCRAFTTEDWRCFDAEVATLENKNPFKRNLYVRFVHDNGLLSIFGWGIWDGDNLKDNSLGVSGRLIPFSYVDNLYDEGI